MDSSQPGEKSTDDNVFQSGYVRYEQWPLYAIREPLAPGAPHHETGR